MRSQSALRAAIIVVAGMVTTAVWADDLYPPTWRGLPRTTFAEWEFLTPASSSIAPDGVIPPVVGDGSGPGVLPSATMSGPLLHDTFDGDGAWIGIGLPNDPPGQIILEIPNWIDDEPHKLIQIQMIVQQYVDNTDPLNPILVTPRVASIDAVDAQAGPITGSLVSAENEDLMTNGLFHRTELWQIRPNPDYERIVIHVPTDTLVDQIVVDTISFVPEPAVFAQIAIAALGMAVLHWRRR